MAEGFCKVPLHKYTTSTQPEDKINSFVNICVLQSSVFDEDVAIDRFSFRVREMMYSMLSTTWLWLHAQRWPYEPVGYDVQKCDPVNLGLGHMPAAPRWKRLSAQLMKLFYRIRRSDFSMKCINDKIFPSKTSYIYRLWARPALHQPID